MKDINQLYSKNSVTSKSRSEIRTSYCTKPCSASRNNNSSWSVFFFTGVRRYETKHIQEENKQMRSCYIHMHAHTCTHSLTHSPMLSLQSRNTPVSGWLSCAGLVVSDTELFSCGSIRIVLCVLTQIRIQFKYFSLAWIFNFQILLILTEARFFKTDCYFIIWI